MTSERNILRTPTQARSRETLERLVSASSRLLSKANWTDISIVQIVREAGSSVGAFYTRFRDKDALLDYLDELYAVDFINLFCDFGPEHTGAATLRQKVELVIDLLGRFYRERAGVARALVLRARMLREPAYEERTTRMNDVLKRVYEAFLSHAEEIEHANTGRAVFFAFNLAFFPLRERILFPETIQDPEQHGDIDFASELSRAVMLYLCPGAEARRNT